LSVLARWFSPIGVDDLANACFNDSGGKLPSDRNLSQYARH
jgi:hypothetical protein